MGNVPKLADLRRAAIDVLMESLRPIHYGELARLALKRLDWTGDDHHERDAAEDLREKALAARSEGLAYIPRPYCLGVMEEWFARHRRYLVNVDGVRVDVPAETSIAAGVEMALRLPHILNKYGDPPETHARRIMKGLYVQHAVSDWVKARWPMFWRSPANDGRYEVPCDHDFAISLPSGRAVLVDVAGPGRDGLFGTRAAGKPAAELHLIAREESLVVHLLGCESRSSFRQGPFAAEQSQPIWKFIVWLNCEAVGLKYGELAAAVGNSEREYLHNTRTVRERSVAYLVHS